MSRLEPLPYYRWHWRDYRANRKVQRLLTHHVPRGLYRDLLDEQWAEGFIPGDDLEALADICFCPVQVITEYWPVLRQFFRKIDENIWVNDRMDRERTGKDAERVKRAVSGAKGGKVKAVKNLIGKHELETEAPASTCHIAGALAEQEHKQEQEQEQCAPPPMAPAAVTANPIVIAPDGNDADMEAMPDGYSDIDYARMFWERVGQPFDGGTLQVTSSAIRIFSERERLPMRAAAMQFLARAKLAIEAGEIVNRFWFTDGKHTRDTEKGNGKRTPQDELNERNGQELSRALASRRRHQPVDSPDRAVDADPGTEQLGYRGTLVPPAGRLPPKRS